MNSSHQPRPAPHDAAPHSADPRSPFVFDLRELGRRPGSLREYRRSVPSPGRLGSEVIGVPDAAAIDLDVRLESVTEGVLVTGQASAPVAGQCARCLDPISDEITVDICELFAYARSATDETTGEDELYRVDGDRLDTESVVRDAMVLALPWTPVCRADCLGLCPECGQPLDELPADHAHDDIDPRWAALLDSVGGAARADGQPTGSDRSG